MAVAGYGKVRLVSVREEGTTTDSGKGGEGRRNVVVVVGEGEGRDDNEEVFRWLIFLFLFFKVF